MTVSTSISVLTRILGGPSQIQAYIPTVNGAGIATTWQHDDENAGIEKTVESGRFDKLLSLQNKKPKWASAHGGHVLNFQVGRLLAWRD